MIGSALVLALATVLGSTQLKTAAESVPTVELGVTKRTKIRLNATGVLLGLPVQCDGEGRILGRPMGTAAQGDAVLVEASGKEPVAFSVSRINDVEEPRFGRFFIGGNRVYLLVSGTENGQRKQATIRAPDGSVSVAAETLGRQRQYIAQFDLDGNYLRSVKLDLPFRVTQIAAFDDGTFVAAGFDEERHAATTALLDSSGQFLHSVEMESDVRMEDGWLKERADTAGVSPEVAFERAVMASEFIPDGNSILLFRRRQPVPVFAVQRTAQATARRLGLPEGWLALTLKSGKDGWLVSATKQASDGAGQDLTLFLVSRTDGSVIRRYKYPPTVGVGLACFDNEVMTFVRRDPINGFELVELAPELKGSPAEAR